MKSLVADKKTKGASVQPKLMVNAPGDRYEQEADVMAERVVGMSGGSGNAVSTSMIGKSVMRKCAECEEEEKKETKKLMRKEQSGGGFDAPASMGAQLQSAKAEGAPMADSTRLFMEDAFSADFSNVRIHTDSTAAAMSKQINAKAFTYGSDIYFNSGQYITESVAGRKLLAHELTHTLQQSCISPEYKPIQRFYDNWDYGDSFDVEEPEPVCTQMSFDPCDVTEWLLTNGELIELTKTCEDYMKSTGKGDCQYYDFWNLQRRLYKERDIRIRTGHGWLADYLTDSPLLLFEIKEGFGTSLSVLPADVKLELGVTRQSLDSYVISLSQFSQMLLQWNIPPIDVVDWFNQQYSEELVPLHLIIPPQNYAPVILDMNPLGMPGISYQNPLLDALVPQDGLPGLSNYYDFYNPGAFFTAATAGSGIYQGPVDLSISGALGEPVYSSGVNFNVPDSMTGSENRWRGLLAEVPAYRGSIVSVVSNQNLNPLTTGNNFPVFDFRNRFTGYTVSIASSTTTDQGYYIEKFRKAIGAMERAKYNTALGLLSQNFGTSTNVTDANANTYLAVNEDHVSFVRDRLTNRSFRNSIQRSPGNYLPLLEYLLREGPVMIGNLSINNWNDLQQARANNTAGYDNALDILASRASERIIGNGIVTQHLLNLQAFRANYQNVPGNVFGAAVGPELIEASRYATPGFQGGDVSSGFHKMATKSAIRGGATSTGLNTVWTIGSILADSENHPYPYRELAINMAVNSGISTGSIYLESYSNAAISKYFLNRSAANIASGGSGAFMARMGFATRGVSSAGFGGLASSGITLASMGINDIFFDADYSRIDYAAKGGRALVTGTAAAAGGWLATAAFGAAVGSEVPIVGTIIGFGVGALVGWLTDEAVGDDVEAEIREGMGEYGCVGVQHSSAPELKPGTPVDETPRLPSNLG